MKRIGFLIMAIITALACSLGTLGCGKKEELKITDYFENNVGIMYYTTDETSEYYEAEKQYGLLPIGNDTLPLVPFHGQGGLIDDNTIQKQQFYSFMIYPKLNAHEIILKDVEFDVETDTDCTLRFRIMGMVGLDYAGDGSITSWVECKANELTHFEVGLNFEYFTGINGIGWTKKEAGAGADWEKKKLAIVLVNKGNEHNSSSVGDAKYIIKNLKFNMRKA